MDMKVEQQIIIIIGKAAMQERKQVLTERTRPLSLETLHSDVTSTATELASRSVPTLSSLLSLSHSPILLIGLPLPLLS